jgi:hypothetical protein
MENTQYVLCSLKYPRELPSLVSCRSVWRPTPPASCELPQVKSECWLSRFHASDELLCQWHVGQWSRVLAGTAFLLKLLAPPVNELVYGTWSRAHVSLQCSSQMDNTNVFSQAVTIVTTRAPPSGTQFIFCGHIKNMWTLCVVCCDVYTAV